MMNFKSPYDSNEIREGLMSIKQSQMELLRQLKNQNHILKKYTPQNPIYQQKSQSNMYNNSSPPYSPHSNFQSNQKHSFLPTNSYLSTNNKQQQDIYHINTPQKSLSNINFQSYNNNLLTQRQLQSMREQFHRMKKNYFNQKQKNKDMQLHMQFAASLHNTILRDILQGNTLDSLKTKIRSQVDSYQRQFPQFRAFGIQQAFNIINLQSDINIQQPRTPTRRTQIFSTKFSQQNNELLLKQINDLKCELRQISLQKQRRVQQVRLIKSEKQYSLQILSRELEMKRGKIDDLVGEIIRLKQSNKQLQKENKLLQKQNKQLNNNIIRLKSQLQRLLNKIQTLQTYNKQSTTTIQKQHIYIKKIQSLQTKLNLIQKQTQQKSKLIQLHQSNITQLQNNISTIKAENDKLRTQLKLMNQQIKNVTISKQQLQDQLTITKHAYQQQLIMIQKRNQTQQLSLKQHIQQLKLNLQQFIQLQHQFKLSQQNLNLIKEKKIQSIKLTKTIDHLWKIKQVQYSNIQSILTQLNLIKSPNVDHLIINENNNNNNQKNTNTNINNNKNTNDNYGIQNHHYHSNKKHISKYPSYQEQHKRSSKTKTKQKHHNQYQ